MDKATVTRSASVAGTESATQPLSFDDAQAAAAVAQYLDFNSPQSLLLSYGLHNPQTKPRSYGALFKIFKNVCDLGHNIFPNTIRPMIVGKDVMDFGCGNTLYGAAFRAMGARSYVGVDPRLDISRRNFRSRHLKANVQMDVSLENVIARIPHIEYYRNMGMLTENMFDLIVLHTVTEHLSEIGTIFDQLSDMLRPGGQIWFLHSNYYSWSGHQQAPKNVKDYVADNAEHQRFADWAHVGAAGNDAEATSTLNRIRLPHLKAIVEQRFNLAEWTEIEDSKAVQARLTPEIEARNPDFSREELLTKQVICRAEKPAGEATRSA